MIVFTMPYILIFININMCSHIILPYIRLLSLFFTKWRCRICFVICSDGIRVGS